MLPERMKKDDAAVANVKEDNEASNNGVLPTLATTTRTSASSASPSSLYGSKPPNCELSADDKNRKRALKAWMRLASKQQKLVNRLDMAKERQDWSMVERTKVELEKVRYLLVDTVSNFGSLSMIECSSRKNPAAETINQQARLLIEGTYHNLQKALSKEDEDGDVSRGAVDAEASLKDHRNAQARVLLLNMTKGTQQLHMFRNQAALRGYLRQKFIERAVLVTTSLSKLVPYQDSHGAPPVYVNDACRQLWERLRTIGTVVSIGCGPGCDALGVAAWVSSLTHRRRRLRQAVLLDWAMPDWQASILERLQPFLVPQLLDRLDLASCDVTAHVTAAVNQEANSFLAHIDQPPEETETTTSTVLYVTSYLLSETRGRWSDFYRQLWRQAAPGSLFLMTDPTAWQVRVWLEERQTDCDANDGSPLVFSWLDSSMHFPALQSLEKRVGPAAVFAMKPYG
jgi:hypothetical protein